MESYRKAGNKLSKCVQVWDLQICSSNLIRFFAVLVTLFCFVYFAILQFTPSGGLLLNISVIRSFSHLPSQSPTHTHTHNINNNTLHPQETLENGSQESFPSSNPLLITPYSNKDSPNPPLITPYSNKDSFISPYTNDPFVNSSSSTNPNVESSPSTSPIVNYLSQSSTNSISELSPSVNPILNLSTPTDPIRYMSPSLSPKEPSNMSSGLDPMKARESKNEEEEEDGYTISVRPRKKLKPGECNLFEGKWVRDESYPLYRSQACPFIDEGFRCQENGRPDEDYLKWRWQPAGCNLPRGCYFQVGSKVNKSMGVRDGFGRAMQTWRQWIKSNIDPLKTRIFFRTYAPVHFSGGTWKTGGRCEEEREPYAQESKFMKREPWSNGVVIAQTEQVPHVTLLDVTHLSYFRKDAHASIYNVRPSEPRSFNHQDCSHWCLPGLPDTWNELLYATLLGPSLL